MSNSNFEKAKEEANRIANDMRAGAERIKDGEEKGCMCEI